MAARTASVRPIRASGDSGAAAKDGSAGGVVKNKANAIRQIGLINAPPPSRSCSIRQKLEPNLGAPPLATMRRNPTRSARRFFRECGFRARALRELVRPRFEPDLPHLAVERRTA